MNKIALTPVETGKRLGLSPALVRTAMKNGELPSVKIGKRSYVPIAALNNMLMEPPASSGKKARRRVAA